MRNFILLFLLFIGLNKTMAQMRFAAKAGLNLADLTTKELGETDKIGILPTFNVGVVADYAFSDAFSFQPGLQLSMKGAKQSIDFLGTTVKSTVSLAYVELPLNLVYRLKVGDKIRIPINVGPYVGFGVSGKAKTDAAGNKESTTLHFGSGDDDDIKPLDFGLNFGAGAEFNNKFGVGVNYGLGLSNNAIDGDKDNSLKNSVIAVNFTYWF